MNSPQRKKRKHTRCTKLFRRKKEILRKEKKKEKVPLLTKMPRKEARCANTCFAREEGGKTIRGAHTAKKRRGNCYFQVKIAIGKSLPTPTEKGEPPPLSNAKRGRTNLCSTSSKKKEDGMISRVSGRKGGGGGASRTVPAVSGKEKPTDALVAFICKQGERDVKLTREQKTGASCGREKKGGANRAPVCGRKTLPLELCHRGAEKKENMSSQS